MESEKIISKKLSIEQKINRLKEKEYKLKSMERKNRNRKIFELGGLVAKAKIDHLNSDQLLGAFLTILEQSQNPETLQSWAKKGGIAFAKDRKNKGNPIIVTFKEKPNAEIRKQLREFGLKWNSFREEWQGITHVDVIQDFINSNNGQIIEVKKTN